MDIVEKIALVPGNPATGKPNDEVIIEDIELYTIVDSKEFTYTIKDTELAKQQAIAKNKKLLEKKEETLKTKTAMSGDTV
jgi:hypothetical protein